MSKIGAVWPVLPVSATPGGGSCPGGTAGQDQHTAGAFGRVRGHRDGGVAERRFESRKMCKIGGRLVGFAVSAVTHDPDVRFPFRLVPRDQRSGGIGMGGWPRGGFNAKKWVRSGPFGRFCLFRPPAGGSYPEGDRGAGSGGGGRVRWGSGGCGRKMGMFGVRSVGLDGFGRIS